MIIAKELSKNSKTGTCAAVYAPLNTCPETCPFRTAGCYARNGKVGMHARRITTVAQSVTQLEIARAEAKEIRAMSGKKPLRLHVSGDFHDAKCADIIDSACGDYTKKHGQPVWAYTHNWRNIDRVVFKHISILASCESVIDAKRATQRGYAVALVIPTDSEPENTITCRHTTHNIQCVDCQLCLHADKLTKYVGFFPHGAQRKTVESIVKRNNEVR